MIESLKDKYHHFKQLSLWRKVTLVGGAIAIVLVLIPLLTYAYFARDIANEERLMNRNNTGVIMLDRHGEEFYRAYNATASDTEPIAFSNLPPHLIDAVIASEDRGFYDHSGYSLRRTLASLYGNVLNRDPTMFGGSTITQQLAKNALLRDEKSYFRKYQELALAIAIERHYEKDKILELYLNSVYFGEGSFGIEDAATTYFDKSAVELTPAESAMLIGILPAPSAWSPVSGDVERARERQLSVLAAMNEVGFIDEEEQEQIAGVELTYAPSAQTEEDTFAMHFAEMVLDELREDYSEERIARSGFEITTTLDTKWQEQAEATVSSHIDQIRVLNATNGAVVVIDPGSGEIRTLVGSVDWNDEDFGKVNMATSPRQPGSSFKPIYYAEALSRGDITPITTIADEPTTFGGSYEPENFDRRFRGDVTVRSALANSLNIPAVKVVEELGVEETVEVANRMGLDSIDDPETYGLSLALGTAEVPLLDLTNVYAAFGDGGLQYTPTTIEQIDDKFGDRIYQNNGRSKRVLDEAGSFLISSILSDSNARAATFGTSLNLSRPAAVKTGTTDDNRDALTVGYTRNIAVGVWVGNNSNEEMSSIAGSSGAAPIWRGVMNAVLADVETEEFPRPGNVVSRPVCFRNNLVAESDFEGTYTEYFLRGTIPEGRCEAPPEPEPEPEPEEEPEPDPEPEEQPEDIPESEPEEDVELDPPEEENEEEGGGEEGEEEVGGGGDGEDPPLNTGN